MNLNEAHRCVLNMGVWHHTNGRYLPYLIEFSFAYCLSLADTQKPMRHESTFHLSPSYQNWIFNTFPLFHSSVYYCTPTPPILQVKSGIYKKKKYFGTRTTHWCVYVCVCGKMCAIWCT